MSPCVRRPLAISSLLLALAFVVPPAAARAAARAGSPHPKAAKKTQSSKEHTAPTLRFGPFGEVSLYGDAKTADQIVLFVSGDGGWNLGVVDMAREFAGLGHLVVGIDIRSYYKTLEKSSASCLYPASDFEQLAQFVEQKLGVPTYRPPVLVGYSSGATLVYALLAQSPTATFRGAVSLGFCPDFPVRREFCHGRALAQTNDKDGKSVDLLSTPELGVPWAVLQGEIDQVCDPASTRAYAARIPSAILFDLPHVGHGFSVPRHWMPQMKEAFRKVVAANPPQPAPSAPAVADLPLVELPGSGAPRDEMAVILSGDGGWAGLDKEVGGALAQRGIPVVGWSSLQYFWKARTPESTASDLARVLDHYLAAWNKDRVVLVGYSFGADVMPFLVNRLPAPLRSRIAEVVLISPARTAQFEFHVSEWLGKDAADARPTAPELAKLAGLRVLCFRGEHEEDSGCLGLPAEVGETLVLPGGHHFAGAYQIVADHLVQRLPAGQ